MVMWRNSPHDMLSSGKFLHMINVGKLCHMEKFLNIRNVRKICHMEKFIHMGEFVVEGFFFLEVVTFFVTLRADLEDYFKCKT